MSLEGCANRGGFRCSPLRVFGLIAEGSVPLDSVRHPGTISPLWHGQWDDVNGACWAQPPGNVLKAVWLREEGCSSAVPPCLLLPAWNGDVVAGVLAIILYLEVDLETGERNMHMWWQYCCLTCPEHLASGFLLHNTWVFHYSFTNKASLMTFRV